MKKTLLFLSCLMMIFSSCSNDNDLALDAPNAKQSKLEKIRWYGTKLLGDDAIQTKGVSDAQKLWNPTQDLKIKFLNTPSDPALLEKVKTTAKEWEEYAGIKFNFVEQSENAPVRIAFDWDGNDWLTWSYVGSDARFVRSQAEPTAMFGSIQDLDEEEFKGDVLRVFGQILGLEYEQRHIEWKDSWWKKKTNGEYAAQSYWEDMFDGMNMDWEEISEYVFTPLSTQNASTPLYTKEIDEESVMAWPHYTTRQTSKRLANYELSAMDKDFIAKLYPKTSSLPTIQEAWVDAGFFTWVKEGSVTSLKITELGREQETFPDVCDGEQLNSANRMFLGAEKLKKAPLFNTSNITDFEGMLAGCKSLTSIPKLDTSNGTDFEGMFAQNESLTSIPELNTENGSDFYRMFYKCTSLTSIPKLNTVNGTDFSGMFYDCTSLTSVPELNTAKGTMFVGMFYKCHNLTSIPKLDTANGTIFNVMFFECWSLAEVPKLDTTKGTDFNSMFFGCWSLVEVPELNTENGTIFVQMFAYCGTLTSIPGLNTAKGTGFTAMFRSCKNLTRIPELNTEKGTKFSYMFEECSSLLTKPVLNISHIDASEKIDVFKGTKWENDPI